MSARPNQRALVLRKIGATTSREAMSQRVIAAVAEFDGSYRGAMELAGRLKAIAQLAKGDDYWNEQVSKGYDREFFALRSLPAHTPSEVSDG